MLRFGMEWLRSTGGGSVPATTGSSPFSEFMLEHLASEYSADDLERIIQGCSCDRKQTLRANTLRTTAEEVAKSLSSTGVGFNRVPWFGDAFILESKADMQATSLFEEGLIYMQNLSAMVPALVLGDCAGKDVCDMCAAPGGKTTQIAALSDGKAMIMACEMHKPRAEKLQFNLERQGATNVTVLNCDARNLDEFFSFDRVLLDAPCTGSGTISPQNAKQAGRITKELLAKTMRSQKALLAKALKLLRPGGTLVYSTCSLFEEENEAQVRSALESAKSGEFKVKPIEVPALPAHDLLPTTLEGALKLCPTNTQEGFFVAKIVRS